MKQTRQSGNIAIAALALLFILFIAWFGWKFFRKLKDWHPDPHHGQGTNAAMLAAVSRYLEEHPEETNLTIAVTQFNLTLPVSALNYDWYIGVRESSNGVDWVNTDLDWEEALELNRTNHSQPMKFYQRVLVY